MFTRLDVYGEREGWGFGSLGLATTQYFPEVRDSVLIADKPRCTMVKNLPANAGEAGFLSREGPLEEEMVTHSSILEKFHGQRSPRCHK